MHMCELHRSRCCILYLNSVECLCALKSELYSNNNCVDCDNGVQNFLTIKVETNDISCRSNGKVI